MDAGFLLSDVREYKSKPNAFLSLALVGAVFNRTMSPIRFICLGVSSICLLLLHNRQYLVAGYVFQLLCRPTLPDDLYFFNTPILSQTEQQARIAS